MNFSDNAIKVLEARYLARDGSGEIIETPNQMLRRVADHVAGGEPNLADEFYDLMDSGSFLPNSPTLMNAGLGSSGRSLSACFVIPIPDTMEGIMDAAKAGALVQKFGGGTGYALSRLRPQGSSIASTHGAACGPLSVLLHLDDVSRLVTQGGKRLGANMAVLDMTHPDIMDFIKFKSGVETDPVRHAYNVDKAMNFNISVGVSASEALLGAKNQPIVLVDPNTSNIVGTVDNMTMVHEIAERAWQSGDPGLVFLDRMNHSRANPVPSMGPIETTNPCGEQPLYAWDSCTLGSINLAGFITNSQVVNWAGLEAAVHTATTFLDHVLTTNDYPLPAIRTNTLKARRIGLGVMGFADALYKLHIRYGSEASLSLARELSEFINYAAWETSRELAEKYGAFPAWADSIYAGTKDWKQGVPTAWQGIKIRNATRTTIAPTGTISIIADVSGGIEPNYQLAYERRSALERSDGGKLAMTAMTVVNPILQKTLNSFNYDSAKIEPYLLQGTPLQEALVYAYGSDHGLPPRIVETFVTAHDLRPIEHIEMQAAFQSHVDNAVSKTVNLPNTATIGDVEDIMRTANELGCMGITVFRDGCRTQQVLSTATSTVSTVPTPPTLIDPSQESAIAVAATVNVGDIDDGAEAGDNHHKHVSQRGVRKRLPTERESITHKFRVGDQEGYLTVGKFDDGCPGEIFLMLAQEGSTLQGLANWASIMTSIALQYGAEPADLARKMIGTRFEPRGMTGNSSIPIATSIPDYIFRWLVERFDLSSDASSGTTTDANKTNEMRMSAGLGNLSGITCTQCGQEAYLSGGCLTCPHCGWSNCG